jgi:hypothetical protein
MKTSVIRKGLKAYGGSFTALTCLVLAAGCGSDASGGDSGGKESKPETAGVLRGTVGASGGVLVGQVGSALEGVRLNIPAGALDTDTEIEIKPATAKTALPSTAVECGPEFEVSPPGIKLAKPATITLPFSEQTITDNYRFDDEVKAWTLDADASKWSQQLQSASSEGSVDIDIDHFSVISAGVNPPADTDLVKFDLKANPKTVGCLAQYPDDPKHAPQVTVVVVRGSQNDGLFLVGKNIKPGLQFDMFTVERDPFLSDGTSDANFKGNFGMAWYQSDLEANENGRMTGIIRTILLDQIFGFDPTVSLPPTNTFEVGFWFNNPEDAKSCGFDVTMPTPFNGEHKAGPFAMISTPADSGLGPLCTKPDTSVSPARCDP